MAKRVDVGVDLYLFMADDAAPAPHLVVSAHGGYFPQPKSESFHRPGWLRVPQGMELFFYVDDGVSLLDPGNDKILAQDPVEIRRGGEMVHNYLLGKYQGRHTKGSPETYDSIKTNIDTNRTFADIQEEMLAAQDIHLSNPMDPDARLQQYEAKLAGLAPAEAEKLRRAWGTRRHERYDVLTVRHRHIGLRRALLHYVTLREALTAIQPHGYRKIHCNFCRVNGLRELVKLPNPSADAVPGTTWERKPDGSRR
jgi:hypothetical protein